MLETVSWLNVRWLLVAATFLKGLKPQLPQIQHSVAKHNISYVGTGTGVHRTTTDVTMYASSLPHATPPLEQYLKRRSQLF